MVTWSSVIDGFRDKTNIAVDDLYGIEMLMGVNLLIDMSHSSGVYMAPLYCFVKTRNKS